MTEKFHCPSCGAPLSVPSDVGATLPCPYCGGSVVVPENMRPERPRGQTPPGGDDPDILDALRAGNKIEAIKIYRQRSGCGLAEAKQAMDAAEANLVAAGQIPGKSSQRSNSACGPVLAIFLIGLLVAGGIFLYFLSQSHRIASDTFSQVQQAIETLPAISTVKPEMASLIASFGQAGEGAGKMSDVRSVAQDRDGTVYAADYLPGRVQVFSPQGEFISQWKLENPQQPLISITALDQGRLAVVTSHSIGIYEGRSGKKLTDWTDGDKQGYNSAWLMASGNLLATRCTASDDDVLIFDPQGKVIKRWEKVFDGQTGNGEMEMKAASDLDGNIYVLGSFNRMALKFNPDGKFITRISGPGQNPGELTFPDALAVTSSGQVLISQTLDILVFNSQGSYMGSFKTTGPASGMAMTSKDELLVAAREQVLSYELHP